MAKKRLKPLKNPVQKRSQETVAIILEAGVRILNKQGWDAFTTRNVADHAGVSYGSFYQYFPNRESLLRTITLDRLEKDVNELKEVAQAFEAERSPKILLRNLVSLLVRWHKQDLRLRTVMYQKVSELQLGTEVLKAQQNLINMFVEIAAKIKGSNSIPVERIAVLFYAVLGVCHALESLSQTATFKNIEEALYSLVSRFLDPDLDLK